MLHRSLLALPLSILVAACSHAPAPSASPPAADANARPQAWLLGEVHDNAAGHAARAALLRQRVESGWRPAIAMEQFDTGQQAALDAAMRDCADAACVVEKVVQDTSKSGWTWPHYEPVIALALEYRLPLLAANLSRADASKIVRGGFEAALPAGLIARYRLDDLPAEVVAAQETEVRDSHCGALPEPMVAPMARAQIARDVVMAETMRAHAASGVALVAGNGHVRNDIAVPFWLRRDSIAHHAIGFLEPGSDVGVFDEVRRVPAAERPDPCAGFQAPKAS